MTSRLNVEIGDVKRVFLDEFTTRFNNIAHELDENIVCFSRFLHSYLQQGACVAIQGCLPKLLGVHFAKTFVALNGKTLASDGVHGLIKGDRSRQSSLVSPSHKRRGRHENLA